MSEIIPLSSNQYKEIKNIEIEEVVDLVQLKKEVYQHNTDINYLISVRDEKQAKIDIGKSMGLSDIDNDTNNNFLVTSNDNKIVQDDNKDNTFSLFKPSSWFNNNLNVK